MLKKSDVVLSIFKKVDNMIFLNQFVAKYFKK